MLSSFFAVYVFLQCQYGPLSSKFIVIFLSPYQMQTQTKPNIKGHTSHKPHSIFLSSRHICFALLLDFPLLRVIYIVDVVDQSKSLITQLQLIILMSSFLCTNSQYFVKVLSTLFIEIMKTITISTWGHIDSKCNRQSKSLIAQLQLVILMSFLYKQSILCKGSTLFIRN